MAGRVPLEAAPAASARPPPDRRIRPLRDRAAGLAEAPPELLIVLGAISVQGGGGIAAQLLVRHSAPLVVGLRIVLAAALLLIWRRPRRGAAIDGRAWRLAILLGVVMAAMNGLFYFAIERIPLGVAVTIEFWGPMAVAVVGSRRPRDLAWVVLAGVGIWLLAGGRFAADDTVGVAAAFGAGGCWAAFILVGGRMARAWPDGRGLTVSMAAAALVVLPVALAGGAVAAILDEPGLLAGGLAIALLSSTIPYTLEVQAMRRLPASTYGVLMSIEPAIAAIVGFVLLGQLLSAMELLAVGLVAVASAGASLTSRRLVVAPGELEGG